MNERINKLTTMNEVLKPEADIDRHYQIRKEGGRRFVSF